MNQNPNIVQVPIERDIDVTTVDATRDVLNRLIEGGCRQIVLNMAEVHFVDSAGMAMLLAEVRLMRSLHGLLSLTNVSDQVLSLFKRARLVDFVPISSAPRDDVTIATDPTAMPLWRTVVPISSDDLASTRATIAHLFEQSPLSPSELVDAMLATGEAMGNAVDHTEGSDATATVTSFADRVVIEVSDSGPGFDPKQLAASSDPSSERGRGIRLMNLVSDSVSITPKPSGNGTLVRIVKLANATAN